MTNQDARATATIPGSESAAKPDVDILLVVAEPGDGPAYGPAIVENILARLSG
jgi:hypothetical protein